MRIIKRVIDAEKRSWVEGYSVSDMLDRIEAAVMTYVTEIEQALGTPRKAAEQRIAELEKRIAELEAQLEAYRYANGSKADRIQKMKEQYEEDMRSQMQYIAELKAQLPKTAKPTIICDGIWSFACGECQRPVNMDECYCAKCGVKIDWT